MVQELLISISEASQILGVSEAALRQWTDEGKIKAFITPGGHRRYSKTELKRFVTSQQKRLNIKDLVVELEDTTRLHREIAQTSFQTTPWYNKLNAESQEHLADLGRRLLHLIVRYIAEPSKREEITKLARDVGHDHGETLAKLDLPLTDSVEAFILHRNSIMNATVHLVRKREALSGRVVQAIPLVTHIVDEALVTLVAAHQEYRNQVGNDSEGGTTK